MRILAVDDSSVIRKIIKVAAEVLQMDVIEAEDGVEALELLRTRDDIGLVLLDWNMPELSGFEVLVEIKNNEKLKGIPVMMVTTEGQKSSIVAAVRAGADNYLTKPFTIESLMTKILECIGEG